MDFLPGARRKTGWKNVIPAGHDLKACSAAMTAGHCEQVNRAGGDTCLCATTFSRQNYFFTAIAEISMRALLTNAAA